MRYRRPLPVRRLCLLAKSGGGWMYDYQEIAGHEGYCDLWLYSVKTIDDNYFVLYRTFVHTVKNVSKIYFCRMCSHVFCTAAEQTSEIVFQRPDDPC